MSFFSTYHNELLFFGSAIFTVLFSLFALRLGKEALVGSMVVQGIVANIFLVKEMHIFGKVATCGDVFIIGLVLSLNLLQEYFGRNAATRTVNAYFLMLTWFLCVKTIHLAFVPTSADCTHKFFVGIFSNSTRIILASLGVSFAALHFDRIIYRFLMFIFGERFLVLRNFVTISLSQLLDTVLFTYIALYGVISAPKDVILVCFSVKLFTIALVTPFMFLASYCRPKKFGI
jgi:uncharacterized integral membrane protein (TIGR00697 family)